MRHKKNKIKKGNRSKNVWKTWLGLNSLALHILNQIIYTIINGLAEIMSTSDLIDVNIPLFL